MTPRPASSDASPWMLAAVRPSGQKVVIVGGGAVARRRAEHFATYGAHVRVYDPFADTDTPWPEGVKFYRRRISQRDLQKAWLIVIATDDPETNQRVADWADELGLEVNRADDVNAGSFAVPSLIEDPAGWQLAILSGEAGPLFSTWLKGVLQQAVTLPKINQVHHALKTARQFLKTQSISPARRSEILQQIMALALESIDPINPIPIIEDLLRE